MRYFRRFIERVRERDAKGFTIIEAALTIPMLALVGTSLFMLMAKSITIMHTNSTAMTAGGEIRVVMNEAREAKNCYQLKQLTLAPKKFSGGTTSPFTINSKLAVDCKAGQTVEFLTEAVKDSDSKVLFKSSTKVYVSE